MSSLVSFLRLPSDDRRMIWAAVLLLARMRILVSTSRFNRTRLATRRMVERAGRRRMIDRPRIERLAWAVAAAGRVVPGGRNCLVRALALEVMLARFGYSGELRIGVATHEAGRFSAHAWLESEGRVLIGDFELSSYAPLEPRAGSGL